MKSQYTLDAVSCEQLASQVSRGDAAAWQELVELVWPHLVRQIASHSRGSGERAEDEAKTIATAVLYKLHSDDHRVLRSYFDWKRRYQDGTFSAWLFTVSKNVACDHARSQLGRRPPEPEDEFTVKRLLNEASSSGLLDQLGHRPPITTHQTARKLLEVARSRLEPAQYRALELWLKEYDAEEIARDLELPDAASAIRLVRAAVAMLRRFFRGDPEMNNPA